MAGEQVIGGVTVVVDADTTSYKTKTKETADIAKLAARDREKAAKQAADAEAFAAKFAADAVSAQSVRIVVASRAEAAARADVTKARRLMKDGYLGETGSINIAAAAEQRLAAAKMATAAATAVEAASAETSGHTNITSMQATAAGLRALEGGFNNNLRSMERWVSQSKIVSEAAKGLFQFVGAGTFGYLVLGMGEEVAAFFEKIHQMPKAIEDAFDKLHTSSRLANDELRLTNDNLENEIAKLSSRPQNNLKVALHEDWVEADKLAKRLADDSDSIASILKENKIGAAAGVIGTLASDIGQESTNNVAGTIKYYDDKSRIAGQDRADALRRGDLAEAAKQAAIIEDTKKHLSDYVREQIAQRTDTRPIYGFTRAQTYVRVHGGQEANLNILRGVRQRMGDEQDNEEQVKRQRVLKDEDKVAKDVNGGRLAAANAAREAAARLYHADQLEFEKKERDEGRLSTKATYDFWQDKIGAFKEGSEQYNEIYAKQTELALDAVKAAEDKIAKFMSNKRELASAGGQIGGTIERVTTLQLRGRINDASIRGAGMVDSNQLAIVDAHNAAREREADIMDAAGRSMTQYAAAVELAKVHAKEFAQVMQGLEGILADRQMIAGLNPSKENNRAVAEAQAAIAEANSHRTRQERADDRSMNGPESSGLVGAKDALDAFILSTRDASREMGDFINNTLRGLNGEILRGVSGQRTNFTGMGADVFRNVAGIGLNKAEGSILSMFGLGGKKKPSLAAGDAGHVIVDNLGTGSAQSVAGKAVASFLTKNRSGDSDDSSDDSGGGVKGFFGNVLKSFLPGFASGGAISPNTWAVVGERGPELFHSGGGGTIVPNNKIGSIGGGDGDTHHHYNIDARGATDPAQVHAAIMAAAPHIAAAAMKGMDERRLRRPSSYR